MELLQLKIMQLNIFTVALEQMQKDNNIRQIAGELNAALEGATYALNNNHKKVVIFHDYEGICHHATGFWQRKDKSSQDYYENMNALMKTRNRNSICPSKKSRRRFI